MSARRIAGRRHRLDRRDHPARQGLDFDDGQGIGILLCLAAALQLWARGAGGAASTCPNSPPLATATFQLLASSLMMTVVAAVIERPWRLPMPGTTTWLAMIGLAALSTALAYIVFFQILRRSGSTNVMLVTLLIPVTAILLGISGAGRRHLTARDRRCARDRQRAALDRRTRAQTGSAIRRLLAGVIVPIPKTSR